MSDTKHYDALVLGSGEAGKYVAWTLAKAGRRVAVIERRWVGGSCPNIACLPSKNVIHSARVASLYSRAEEFGLPSHPIHINMDAVRRRKREMVDDLIAVHRKNYSDSGAELIMGEGRFLDPKTIEVEMEDGGTLKLSGDRIYINVGTHAAIPDVPGLMQSAPLTHIEALELDYVPKHLIILGGSYVGLEIAQPMRRFGSEVTVVEHGPQIAGREDGDVAEAVQKRFEQEGITIMTNTRASVVEGLSGNQVRMHLETDSGEKIIEGSDILVAAGRIPNTQHIGLDRAGVETDERGYIKVNDRLQTTTSEVWALGDCAGSPQFTHVAFDDFRVIRDNMNGGGRDTRKRLVPYCMFTDPQVGRVGLSESEAQREGIPYRIAKLPMKSVLRSRTLSETYGFLKALIAADNDQILGFTVVGTGASELIAVVQVAMLAGTPYTRLRDTIFTHPTMAEGLTVLFAAPPRPPD